MPSLHLWQLYFLLAVLGLLAGLWPAPCVVLAVLLLLLQRRLWQPKSLFLCTLLFCGAFFYSSASIQSWRAESHVGPAWTLKKSQPVCGRVMNCSGQPGGFLRIILADVSPVAEPQINSASHSSAGSAGQSATGPETQTSKGIEPVEVDLALLPGLAQWSWSSPDGPAPLPGQTVCMTARVAPLHDFQNAAAPSFEAGWIADDLRWRVSARGEVQISGEPAVGAILRQELLRSFLDLLAIREPQDTPASQARAMLPALLFGDRQFLTRATQDHFAAASLAHSLALSGQHLCVAALMGTLIAVALGWLFPALHLPVPRAHLILLLGWPLALGYLWLGNAPPSLLRAFTMLSIGGVALFLRKPISSLDILLGAAALILIFSPLAAFNTGLQLSILCVGVIMLTAGVQAKLLSRINTRSGIFNFILRGVGAILLTSFLIQLAMLPVSIGRFGNAGLWFCLNTLWLPLLGFVTIPFAAVALLLCQFEGTLTVAHVAANIAQWPCELILNLLDSLASSGWLAEPVWMRPYWAVYPAFALLLLVVSWRNMRGATRRILLGCALLLLACGPARRAYDELTAEISIDALDVGQGESILLSYPGGRVLLDGGGAPGSFDYGARVLTPLLTYNAPPRINAIFSSHPDIDHLGGLIYPAMNFNPDLIFHNGRHPAGATGKKWTQALAGTENHALMAGDVVYLGAGDLHLEVLNPPADASDKESSDNGASLVLRLMKGSSPIALLPGDADRKVLARICGANRNLKTPLVFAPHHGSSKNFLRSYYQRTQPQVVAISSGFRNRWGFPSLTLLRYLTAAKIPFLITSDAGRVRFTYLRNGGLKVEPLRNRSFQTSGPAYNP